MLCLGVNSGTSADAIDCVLCRVDNNKLQLESWYEYPMPSKLQQEIVQAVETPGLRVDDYYALRHKLTECYIQAIKSALAGTKTAAQALGVIGVHGQTIHHVPNAKYPYTLQCINAASIAQYFQVPTIDDFRGVDIALGGQGAPVIPAFCQYLHKCENKAASRSVFLNLGGIANATIVDTDTQQLLGWDIGPANALMDIWIQDQKKQAFDQQGNWAQSGKISELLLAKLLQDPYFKQPLPKSTGRDYFSLQWLQKNLAGQVYSPQDVQATLLALTVATISKALRSDSKELLHCYIYGKGVYNSFLVQRLVESLPQYRVQTTEALGVSPEALEGALFAWLAHCYIEKKPVDLTSITGARTPAVLGCAYWGLESALR